MPHHLLLSTQCLWQIQEKLKRINFTPLVGLLVVSENLFRVNSMADIIEQYRVSRTRFNAVIIKPKHRFSLPLGMFDWARCLLLVDLLPNRLKTTRYRQQNKKCKQKGRKNEYTEIRTSFALTRTCSPIIFYVRQCALSSCTHLSHPLVLPRWEMLSTLPYDQESG